jgi:hypothetical protein
MKTKLFVLSLLLSFVVTVAKAWSGVDDDWWQENYSSDAFQTIGQTYDSGRDFTTNSYGDYVTEDVATLSGSGYDLDWSDFDKAKNEIIEYLNTNRSKLSDSQASTLQSIYDEAVQKERNTIMLWHCAMYNESTIMNRIARYYGAVQEAWQVNIDAAAQDLYDALDMAKAVAQGNELVQQVEDLLAAGAEWQFYGKNTTGNHAAWDAIDAAMTQMKDALADPDVVALNPWGGVYDIFDVQGFAEELANALAMNEKYKKEIDDEMEKLDNLLIQVGFVVEKVDAGEYSLAEPYNSQLRLAQNKAQAAYNALNIDIHGLYDDFGNLITEGRGYDKIEAITSNDEVYNSIAFAVAQLQAAIAENLAGHDQQNALLAGTWTYGQPLPILNPSEDPLELDWTEYNKALSELDGNDNSLAPGFYAAINALVQQYQNKKSAVETEWGTNAFDSDYTPYTLPSQWSYNQTVWNNAINDDAAVIRHAAAVAAAIYRLANDYSMNSVADDAVFKGDLKDALDNAKSAVESYLNEDEADANSNLTDKDVSWRVLNIDAVRQAYLAAVKAIEEEQQDAKTANELLGAAINSAEDLVAKMGEDTDDQKQAKKDLQDAIDAAKTVQTNVNNGAYNNFESAQDVAAAVKTLNAALLAAHNLYNTEVEKAPYAWVYDTPEYEGEKGEYTLDWAEYDAILNELNNTSAAYATDAKSAAAGIASSFGGGTGKKGRAIDQWNGVPAFKNVDPSTQYAKNWSYNQKTWQAGINDDAEYLANVLSMLKVLDKMEEYRQAAKALTAQQKLTDYATLIDEAVTAAETVYDDKKALDKVSEADRQQVMEAASKLLTIVQANEEEKTDVNTATSLLVANITAAQALIDKKYVEEKDVPTLQAQMATAQAIVDAVKAGDYSAIANAKTVTDAYMALTDAMGENVAANHSNHKTDHNPTEAWVYATPLAVGEKLATEATLDWTQYDVQKDMINTLGSQANDAEFQNLLNGTGGLYEKYALKQQLANKQFSSFVAWDEADAQHVGSYAFNKDQWQVGVNADVAAMAEYAMLAQSMNSLYDLIEDRAKTLQSSTKILGAYKTMLDDAITDAETVYKAAKVMMQLPALEGPGIAEINVGVRSEFQQLQAVIGYNAEEMADVNTAAETLKNAIAAARSAEKFLEDLGAPQNYIKKIERKLTDTPNYDKLLANAESQNYTEAGFEIEYAKTLAAAATELNAFVDKMLTTYASGITNITPVDGWVYAQPLRLGDNQDPVDPAAGYTLDWTDYEAAQAELQAATFTSPEIQSIQTIIDGTLTTRETLAQTQWTSEPAWTGTNNKFANQYQYNQTQWQNGIDEDAKNIRKTTKILNVLEQMYLLNTEVDAFRNSELMPQAKSLKKALNDAYDASNALYTALTSDHTLVTETSVAQCEAALVALKGAYNEVKIEEYNDIKTVMPLLASAIQDARAAAKIVEDVDPKTYYTNITTAADEARALYDQAKANDFDGDADGNYVINYAKTLTDAIYKLNKIVRDNMAEYTAGINNIVPTGEDWAYATPLRLGEEKDPAARDASTGETKYTLDWTDYDNALAELVALGATLKDADFAAGAYADAVKAFTDKETLAKDQWVNVAGWEGTNDKFVNQYQYNQTQWNAGIQNDVKQIQRMTSMVEALNDLYQVKTVAEANYIPAADNAKVLKSMAKSLQKRYDAAKEAYTKYQPLTSVTLYDIQEVQSSAAHLAEIIATNNEEVADIYDMRYDLASTIKLAQNAQSKIKDDAEMKWYDELGTAITEATTVWQNARDKKFNEFTYTRDMTKAGFTLVKAMIKQTGLYQDSIRALKDSLEKVIVAARAAALVVNVNNPTSTDLQSEIGAAQAMTSAQANTDTNISKLNAEIAKLKRTYCTAFILDLDELRKAIAEAKKFQDGITPYNSFEGVEKAQEDIQAAIELAEKRLAKGEKWNASQISPADPYTPHFEDAESFNKVNTETLPQVVDELNKAHIDYNLAALKAVADSCQNYLDKEDVVTLYQEAIKQVIDHANQVYAQYQADAANPAVFNNYEIQDKISDAIATAYGDFGKFVVTNGDAIAEATTVRAKLATKIADATTLKGELTDANSKTNLQTAITTAITLKDTNSANPSELTNGITALDLAMRTARWTDDIARLNNAIKVKEDEASTLTDPDAKEIMQLYITKAEALLEKLSTSVYTTVTTADVSNMIDELVSGLKQANEYNNGEMLPDMLAKAAPYKELIPTEYQYALNAQENSDKLSYTAVKAAGDALAEATSKAAAYTAAKEQLQTAINEAKLSEEQTDALKNAITAAETAVAKEFTQDQTKLTGICNDMDAAYHALKNELSKDRWSHEALGGKMIVKPWKPNDPNPGQAQYIKLAGKFTSADANVANNSVDLFITDIQGAEGTRTFSWTPFSVEGDYAANVVNLTGVGADDYNNFKKYGWSYEEHYNDIIIKAGAIYSTGDGFVNANHTFGPFTWTNVWNTNDLDILDKDADGNYYGRYYTFKWTETNEGGVYRIPTLLGIYDETGDQFKVNNIRTYISKPNKDGSYFINSDLKIDGDKGYDTEGTVFNYENGTAILNGRWHRVQFIDKNQFLFHQAAQRAADWFNNAEDLRHYDTEALNELRKAVESDGNQWEDMTKAIEKAMEKVENSLNKVNMIEGDSIYGVLAADKERVYTITGAPGDAIDAIIMAQTNDGWTKDDSGFFQISNVDATVGADSTATLTVKFIPGANYPADYREYRAVLDVKVGNLNYQDNGKETLQQNLYGSNPMLSLKENELLQAHSLNLHRKDSITFDLFGRGYAYNYEKSKLVAKFYSATGLVLGSSEVKTTFAKPEFTCYAEDNDLDKTKFTVSYYPVDLGADVVKVVISDGVRELDDITMTVNAAKSEITFDPTTVKDTQDNTISVEPMADGTMAYFYPADGETYTFPIAIANFDGVNANTKVVNEDGVISITTEKMGADGLVEEHLRHDIQITIDNREYFTVETATTEVSGTSKNQFLIVVKTDKLTQGTKDDGQHNGLLQIIWQDQDTIKINLNQTLPWFSAPTTATEAGPIVDSVDGNIEWEFTEDGDKIWYVDVNDVDNYYNYAVNFGAYTNTDWFIVDPSISYQLTPKRGTRKYRLKITYNPHEVNTVYTDVLTLNIYDTKRNVIVATTSINLKGDAVATIKGGATGVNNAKAQSAKDGKYIKNGKIVIVKGDQEFNASGAAVK